MRTQTRVELVTAPFVLLTVATGMYFAGVGLLLSALPRVVRDVMGGSSRWVGLFAATYSVAAVVVRPALVRVSARRGERWLTVVGGLVGGAATAASAVVGSTVPTVALRVVAGAGEAAFFVGVAMLVNEMAPDGRRAEAASYHSVGVFVGLGLGPLVGDRLSRQLGRAHHPFAVHDGAWAFLVAGTAMVAAALLVRVAPVDEHRPDAPAHARERRPLLHPATLLTGACLALGIAGYTGWVTFLALRVDEVGGVTAGQLLLTYTAITMIARLFGARLPERLGPGRCAAVSFVLFVVALGAATVVDGRAGLWASAALMGPALALLYPSLLALTMAPITRSRDRTAAIASFTAFFEVGGMLGGLVLGLVAGAWGYRAAFGGGALMAAACLPVLWLTVLRPRRAAGA